MQWPQSLWGKRIELLTELLGRPPRRLAWVGNPGNAGSAGNWADAREAARRVGAEIVRIDVGSARDLERAFETAKGRDALLVQFDFLFAVERRRISALVTRQRLPAIYENRMLSSIAGGAVGPWVTGVLHDHTGTYTLAFQIAIACSVVSAVAPSKSS